MSCRSSVFDGNFFFLERSRTSLHQFQGCIFELVRVCNPVLEPRGDAQQVGRPIAVEIDFVGADSHVGPAPRVRGVIEPLHLVTQAGRPDVAGDKRANCYDDADERDADILACHAGCRLPDAVILRQRCQNGFEIPATAKPHRNRNGVTDY